MPRHPPPPERKCVHFDAWPAGDKALWAFNTAPGSVFDEHSFGRDRNPRSLKKFRDGYGRWLGFLTFSGRLNPSALPAERITLEAVRDYFALLRSLGNRDHTVVGRLDELKAALRILAPKDDFSWLTRPGDVSIRTRMQMRKRSFPIPRSAELFRWGLSLIADASNLTPARRRTTLRDGILIAILASRGPRLRTVTELRFGRNLIREADHYRLVVYDDNIKTERPLAYPLPRELTAPLDRYVAVERLELLGKQDHDYVWVNWSGEPLGQVGVEKRIRWRSKKRFDFEFGPHRFRHSLGTTTLEIDPSAMGIATAILGISQDVMEKHYNRGTQYQAGERFQEACEEERSESEGRAKRSFTPPDS